MKPYFVVEVLLEVCTLVTTVKFAEPVLLSSPCSSRSHHSSDYRDNLFPARLRGREFFLFRTGKPVVFCTLLVFGNLPLGLDPSLPFKSV